MPLLTTSLLSFGPRIHRVRNQLHAVTGWRVWLMTLGLSNRRVVVDPDQKMLRIHDRILWFFPKKRSFKFRHIRAVAYGYSDQSGGSIFSLAHDSYDVFSVGIKLHGDDNTYRHLFRFLGDGTFVNDSYYPDWWYWEEYLTDCEGSQERESRRFVELLLKMIGGATIEPV
ncbi:MAG: hypothetical protein U0798_03660 [Gemmataceae bacterium]